MKVFVPTITYQYSKEGEMSNSGAPSLPFTPDIRAVFKRWFIDKYPNHPQAWARLEELTRERLRDLPDNPFVQRQAWLAGVTDERSAEVDGWFTSYESEQAAKREAAQEAARREARRAELRAQVHCDVIRRYAERGEDGEDAVAIVRVRPAAGGEELEFACRNIFDFGYVINPRYVTDPGIQPGGIAIRESDGEPLRWDHWTDDGWKPGRKLTEFEDLCMRYLWEFPPVSDEVRL